MNFEGMLKVHTLLVSWGVSDVDAKVLVLKEFTCVDENEARRLIGAPPQEPSCTLQQPDQCSSA